MRSYLLQLHNRFRVSWDDPTCTDADTTIINVMHNANSGKTATPASTFAATKAASHDSAGVANAISIADLLDTVKNAVIPPSLPGNPNASENARQS